MSANNERLIWTRDASDWESDRQLIGPDLADRVLRLPCLRTQAIDAPLPEDDFSDVVLTSRSAITHASPALLNLMRRAKRVWTHGKATADLAGQAGLPVTYVATARTAADLCTILKRRLPAGAKVLCPGPVKSAFDMAEGLRQEDFETLRLDIYETQSLPQSEAGTPLSAADCQALRPSLGGVLCFASPSAIDGFVAGFPKGTDGLYSRLRIASIGLTTSTAARAHFALIKEARKASIADLLQAASALLHGTTAPK